MKTVNAVDITEVKNLLAVYPPRVVLSILTASEKDSLIQGVEAILDRFDTPPEKIYQLYLLATEETA